MEWDMAASGYAAVWAHENTRASLFDALRRKEAYATTGPRMTVRLFGGWGFTEQDLNDPDWVEGGYEIGVPMGATCPSGPMAWHRASWCGRSRTHTAPIWIACRS